jgi:hypothetical protein
MIPLLVQLGLALAGGIAQKVASDKQHSKDVTKHKQQTVQDIMDKRASRAGDSMYMQQAIAAKQRTPEAPPNPMGGVVAGMGSALLGYNGGTGDAAPSVLEGMVGKGGWSNPAVQGDRGGYEAVKAAQPSAATGNPWDDDEWGDGGY